MIIATAKRYLISANNSGGSAVAEVEVKD